LLLTGELKTFVLTAQPQLVFFYQTFVWFPKRTNGIRIRSMHIRMADGRLSWSRNVQQMSLVPVSTTVILSDSWQNWICSTTDSACCLLATVNRDQIETDVGLTRCLYHDRVLEQNMTV